ncbi:acyl-CoA dehydrogenase family protein [Streptomyces sp. NBC_00365]|uniref:acyl-CoA dehydrogenase family protein n=1 Tax=Streptomyces sp. NBC_00365 TaxID=2975726 RepID=UPI002257F059|nr:acyl-CoA dehydrogenase family protein [Streptomyces sp. NBC_00365]MCX5088726.1 acyl-CoA dehydrogenase family protein [Streptomyces sp. NBC_00365]
MDFREFDELAAHREAACAWVEAHVRPEWVEEQRRSGTHQTAELHALLARDGILAADWPPAYGGSEVDPGFARAVFDELGRMGLASDGWSTTSMVLRTIEHVGTEEQKRAYIPAALRGDTLIALGYSEPDSGSDVAAAKTTAVRDGDEWVIDGQKMFTSTAQLCSHVFVLARTDPNVPKHKGLSMFLVPTDSSGYDIQPIHTLGGQRTNATFYTGVRVPDSARLGGVDGGWGVMHVALVHERSASSPGSDGGSLVRDLAAWARHARRPDGTTVLDDPLAAERIGRMAVDEEVTRLLALRNRWRDQKGELPGVEGSMWKLFATEAAQRHSGDILDILGAEGVLAPEAAGAPAGGRFEEGFRAAVVGTIYGGTSEILREIIAERHLRLPRNR